MVVGFREGEVGLLVHGQRRRNIKHDDFSDFGRVFDANSMGDSGAPVVAAEVEVVKSMMLHDTHAVLCQSSLAVAGVTLFSKFEFGGEPIASEVDDNHAECLCQLLRNSVPNEVILRESDTCSAGALLFARLGRAADLDHRTREARVEEAHCHLACQRFLRRVRLRLRIHRSL